MKRPARRWFLGRISLTESLIAGPTGKPKGVGVTHRGLRNYVEWAISEYQIRKRSSSPVHSSLAVDLTVTSIYPVLCSGGSISLLPGLGYTNLMQEGAKAADYS